MKRYAIVMVQIISELSIPIDDGHVHFSKCLHLDRSDNTEYVYLLYYFVFTVGQMFSDTEISASKYS